LPQSSRLEDGGMIVRFFVVVIAVAVGAALGTVVPEVSQAVRAGIATLGWPSLPESRAKEPAQGASAAQRARSPLSGVR